MRPDPTRSLDQLAGLIGRRTIRALLYPVDLLVFIAQSLRDGWRHGLFNRATYASVVTQVIFSGIDALPTISLLGLAVGISVTSQLIRLVAAFGSEQEVVNVLSEVVVLELGSLLTAFVLISRSGSAIAADLGQMRLRKEVEGLELLGIGVTSFLVVPRLLGMAVAQLSLAVYFSVFAIAAGVTASALLESIGYFKYLWILGRAFSPEAVLLFLGKNLLFGLIVAAAACMHGLQVETSPTEVPQRTQRAIAASLGLILLLDAVLALVAR